MSADKQQAVVKVYQLKIWYCPSITLMGLVN